MKQLLNNNTLLVLIMFLSIIIISIFSCVINDIKKIASDPDFETKWDVDLRVPIVDYSSTPINLGKFVEDKALNSTEVTVPALPQWPLALDPAVINNSIAIDTGIDIDDDSIIDFVLDGYYSQKTNMLEIQIWLTDTGNTVLPINSDCINIQDISIELNPISFNSPVSKDNKLIYTSTNFLDPADEYYLSLGGDNALNFSVDIALLDGSSPNYSGDTYTLHVKLFFDMGDDFGIIGQIMNAAVLKNISGQDIPIGDLPAEELDKFNLEFDYESYLPFDLNINTVFHGSEKTPSPNVFTTNIASGVLSTSLLNGYQYASGINKSDDIFKFSDNVLDYGDMKIDLQLTFPAPTGTQIRLDTNTIIKVKIVASAEATISL